MIKATVTAMYVRKGVGITFKQRVALAARRLQAGPLSFLVDLARGKVRWNELGDRLTAAFSMGAVAGTISPIQGGPAIQAEQKFLHVIGTMVLTGNYPGAPGDIFDITNLVNAAGWTLPAIGNLIIGWAGSVKSTGPSGFSYTIVPGTSLRNATVDVQQGGGAASPNGEISTAAYPAGVLGDTIQFELLLGIA